MAKDDIDHDNVYEDVGKQTAPESSITETSMDESVEAIHVNSASPEASRRLLKDDRSVDGLEEAVEDEEVDDFVENGWGSDEFTDDDDDDEDGAQFHQDANEEAGLKR